MKTNRYRTGLRMPKPFHNMLVAVVYWTAETAEKVEEAMTVLRFAAPKIFDKLFIEKS